MDVRRAVCDLRIATGLTQQAFANRLGMSIRAVANYEKDRKPNARALYQFSRLASEIDRSDLAEVFSAALAAEMDLAAEPKLPIWLKAVREIMRNHKHCPGWETISEEILQEFSGLVNKAKSGAEVEIPNPAALPKDKIRYLEEMLIQLRLARHGKALPSLEEMARARQAETGETYEKAFTVVFHSNPQLYAQYNQEKADAGRGTSFEESLSVYGTRRPDGTVVGKQPAKKAGKKGKP
jgi:transcriptional regulator with XRE-family HTH domain